MPHITRALIRKRAEHNEGIIGTLEEITLHQEELESITEVLGTTCRKLKILYLQNNIIPRMENLHHLKDLEYLNLALNNIEKIEGLDRCEFLNKLDLTVNFIDFDTLEESITHLQSRHHLADLYMMGNPSQMDWEEGFEHYVIHRLPQLRCLDGKDITKSHRIVAAQHFPRLEAELRVKAEEAKVKKDVEAKARKETAEAKKAAKEAKAAQRATERKKPGALVEEAYADIGVHGVLVEDGDADEGSDEASGNESEEGDEDDETCEHTPEARVEMYRELAAEKAEKENREKERQPKERDYDKEHTAAKERIRKLEEEGKIRQTNEGKWKFSFDETSKKGCVVFDVGVPKHLDSSLIDVDVHPNYVSVVIKNKSLRLNLPAEVDASNSKAQRSKTTGHLVLIMPKVNPNENALGLRVESRRKAQASKEKHAAVAEKQRSRDAQHVAFQALHDAREAQQNKDPSAPNPRPSAMVPTGGSVQLRGIVSERRGGRKREPNAMRTVATTFKGEDAGAHALPPPPEESGEVHLPDGDDDEPPPPL